MPSYQWDPDDELWEQWKATVPRSKALHERLNELLRADIEGRVIEAGEVRHDRGEPRAGGAIETEPEPVDELAEPEPEPVESDAIAGAVEAGSRDWTSAADERRAAARAALEFVRDHGPVQKSEIVEAVYPDNTAGYQDERTWWRQCVMSEQYDHDGPLHFFGEYENGRGWVEGKDEE